MISLPVLLTLAPLGGCGSKKDAAPPSHRQETVQGVAGESRSAQPANNVLAAPPLPGDPGYKAP